MHIVVSYMKMYILRNKGMIYQASLTALSEECSIEACYWDAQHHFAMMPFGGPETDMESNVT